MPVAVTISARKEMSMEHDILVAGLMALASVVAALALLWRVARAVREQPESATPFGTAPALRPTQG
jgi:hypothetical protein